MDKSLFVFQFCIFLCIKIVSVGSIGSYLQRIEGARPVEVVGHDIFFEIIEPEDLSYTYRTRPAKNFGSPFNSSFFERGIKLVPVDPPEGCSWPYNAGDISGNVALIERGKCSFLSKTVRAEEVGARAVIIADNMESDKYFTEMIDDLTGRPAHIPATFLLGKNGFIIRRTLRALNMEYAVINIPVNLSFVPLHKMNQPPWLTW